MKRPTDSDRHAPCSYSRWKHLSLLLGLSLALFLKNAPLFLAGQFVSEDSFYFYQTAYNEPFWKAVTTPYAGYLHVLPMMLAELLWNLPFLILPWVNHIIALFLCVACLSWLYMPHCRKLIRSDGLRLACVLVLAATPFQPNLGMLLGLHWYLSFFLGIFLIGDLPEGGKSIAASCVLVVIAAWSAPAAIALIPVALYRWWQERKSTVRYIPLCFAAASIAYALAITFIFKPASAQPGIANLNIAVQACWKMLHEGVLFQSIVGAYAGNRMPDAASFLIKWSITASLALLTILGLRRKEGKGKSAVLLFSIGILILGMTMIRGHQSGRLLQQSGLGYERYLTTPTFYIWTGLFVLLSPYLSRAVQAGAFTRASLAASFVCLEFLLVYGSPPLQGNTSLNEAFSHQTKAKVLASYEQRYADGGKPETLALPGWTPIECMRLKIGGGRECQTPSDLACVFGTPPKSVGKDSYFIDWFGRFTLIDDNWITHERWGRIAILGYSNGYYWFSDPSGQKYLSGPAIYPRRFEYPPKNLIRVKRN